MSNPYAKGDRVIYRGRKGTVIDAAESASGLFQDVSVLFDEGEPHFAAFSFSPFCVHELIKDKDTPRPFSAGDVVRNRYSGEFLVVGEMYQHEDGRWSFIPSHTFNAGWRSIGYPTSRPADGHVLDAGDMTRFWKEHKAKPDTENNARAWVGVPAGQQHCKRCHRAQYVDFTVSDDLWRKAVSPKFRDVALCLECFVLEASEQGIKLDPYGKDFNHLFVVQP